VAGVVWDERLDIFAYITTSSTIEASRLSLGVSYLSFMAGWLAEG
jgi:hypothetical protein